MASLHFTFAGLSLVEFTKILTAITPNVVPLISINISGSF